MAYFKPYIDADGIHIPAYSDILEHLIQEYQSIFGPDVYLDPENPDYQLLSLFAKSMDDGGALCVDTYNSRNPYYAHGSQLDMLLPLVGMIRRPATYSTVELTLTGDEGTVIPAGAGAIDGNGYVWALDSAVTIPASGTITCSATCQTAGAVSAKAGAISEIFTPQIGWTSVTNAAAAGTGLDIELDEEVRVRMVLSSSRNANGTAAGMVGQLINLAGVSHVDILENNTGDTDSSGIPAHSVCVLIEGGDDNEIADVILKSKAPGIGTYGTTEVTATLLGHQYEVYFTRPTESKVHVNVSVKSLDGYDADRMAELIMTSITEDINSLGIGEAWNVSMAYKDIYTALGGETPAFAIQSVTAYVGAGSPTSGILECDFNEVLRTEATSTYFTITVS